jgi:hypothetical protein
LEDPVRRNPRSLWPVAVLLAMSGCMNPEVEAKQWDEIQATNQTVLEMRQYVQDLETLVDSLRNVDMKQDSALRTLVDFTGAQVPAYKPPQ